MHLQETKLCDPGFIPLNALLDGVITFDQPFDRCPKDDALLCGIMFFFVPRSLIAFNDLFQRPAESVFYFITKPALPRFNDIPYIIHANSGDLSGILERTSNLFTPSAIHIT